jgi:peptide/nickel transport system permease protein
VAWPAKGRLVRPGRAAHHRGAAIDPQHSALDGAGGDHAGHLEPALIYFGITIILGLLDWTGLARAVRSKLLALREEDYVLAAQLMGARTSRIIGRHLIPGFMSHLIATATISIPGMILGETALSFLGLGLRPPITSWGILLTEARSVSVIAFYPWLLYPMIPVILVILAFNFLGDGLRDAADPYR